MADVLTEYSSYNKKPYTRLQKKNYINNVDSIFTKKIEELFLKNKNDSAKILTLLNPSLKVEIDTWFSAGKSKDIILYLFKDLDDWFATNYLNKKSITTTLFGTGFLSSFLKIINFFKPYRSRLTTFEFAYTINDILKDSIIVEDSLLSTNKNIFVDFDTARGIPCCDSTSCDQYSRLTYDCGNSKYDLGASDDNNNLNIEGQQSFKDILNYHTPDSTSYLFLEYSLDSTGDIDFIMQSGGMSKTDSGGIFDSYHGNDIVEIYRE